MSHPHSEPTPNVNPVPITPTPDELCPRCREFSDLTNLFSRAVNEAIKHHDVKVVAGALLINAIQLIMHNTERDGKPLAPDYTNLQTVANLASNVTKMTEGCISWLTEGAVEVEAIGFTISRNDTSPDEHEHATSTVH